jgi:hypothetical protein
MQLLDMLVPTWTMAWWFPIRLDMNQIIMMIQKLKIVEHHFLLSRKHDWKIIQHINILYTNHKH